MESTGVNIGINHYREALGTEHEEIWGHGVPLPKTSSRDDLSSDNVINFEGVRDWRDTIHDQIDPSRIKAHFEHKSLQIIPFNMVIGFAHIQLECSITLFIFHVVKPMYAFIADKNVVCDKAPQDESILIGVN